ncbi:hypothetical protein GGS21DRAFT_506034 [Xylaria nigripes]|nr:hypothetical protein GGS21DRAFT_506034 [Xylaria nigripes]
MDSWRSPNWEWEAIASFFFFGLSHTYTYTTYSRVGSGFVSSYSKRSSYFAALARRWTEREREGEKISNVEKIVATWTTGGQIELVYTKVQAYLPTTYVYLLSTHPPTYVRT